MKDKNFKYDINRCLRMDIKNMLRDVSYEEKVAVASAYILGAKAIAEALNIEVEWDAGIKEFEMGYVTFKVGFFGDKNGSA